MWRCKLAHRTLCSSIILGSLGCQPSWVGIGINDFTDDSGSSSSESAADSDSGEGTERPADSFSTDEGGGSGGGTTGASTETGEAECGDGVLASGEVCDDGNLDDSDDCLSSCEPARCGDGVLRAGLEECDPGAALDSPTCTASCGRARTIFVSSKAYVADVVEASGDTICTSLAKQAALAHGLPTEPKKVYRAWLGSPTRDVKEYVRENPGRYVNTQGQVVAESWEDLVAGELLLPVLYDEYGEERVEYVWTGIRAGGELAAEHCEGWTSTSGGVAGRVGYSALHGPDWTDLSWPENPIPCNIALAIYCLEQ